MSECIECIECINYTKSKLNTKTKQRACLKIGYVHQSTGCPSFHAMPSGYFTGKSYQAKPIDHGGVCEETGKKFKVGERSERAFLITRMRACSNTTMKQKVAGPVWLDPIHDFDAVDMCLDRVNNPQAGSDGKTFYPLGTKTRLHGLLTSVSEELSDCPLFYDLTDLASTLRVTVPPTIQFKSALMNAGYRVSSQHKEVSERSERVLW